MKVRFLYVSYKVLVIIRGTANCKSYMIGYTLCFLSLASECNTLRIDPRTSFGRTEVTTDKPHFITKLIHIHPTILRFPPSFSSAQ